jgi:tRNA threonylcarbamoyladenosine biosynthesis protein TsaB
MIAWRHRVAPTLASVMTVLLALDTSTEAMAVALHGPRGVACWNGEGGPAASATLLPRIAELLAGQGLAPADLTTVAFGHGPGAFTGLRTACAVAQGLALGAGAPVVAVDSLAIVAEDAWDRCGAPAAFDVGIAMDARMGELYAARYRRQGAAWLTVAAPALVVPAALPAGWGGWPPVLAGSGLALLGGPEAPRRLPACRDRAAALLRLALAAFERGEAVDAAQALPVYLRDKVALTTRERAAHASMARA